MDLTDRKLTTITETLAGINVQQDQQFEATGQNYFPGFFRVGVCSVLCPCRTSGQPG
jgi:hypothetical protein